MSFRKGGSIRKYQSAGKFRSGLTFNDRNNVTTTTGTPATGVQSTQYNSGTMDTTNSKYYNKASSMNQGTQDDYRKQAQMLLSKIQSGVMTMDKLTPFQKKLVIDEQDQIAAEQGGMTEYERSSNKGTAREGLKYASGVVSKDDMSNSKPGNSDYKYTMKFIIVGNQGRVNLDRRNVKTGESANVMSWNYSSQGKTALVELQMKLTQVVE